MIFVKLIKIIFDQFDYYRNCCCSNNRTNCLGILYKYTWYTSYVVPHTKMQVSETYIKVVCVLHYKLNTTSIGLFLIGAKNRVFMKSFYESCDDKINSLPLRISKVSTQSARNSVHKQSSRIYYYFQETRFIYVKKSKPLWTLMLFLISFIFISHRPASVVSIKTKSIVMPFSQVCVLPAVSVLINKKNLFSFKLNNVSYITFCDTH